MNYKHLSKYHSIYRFSIGGDLTAHVEKLPIAYSNQHYIYVIQPGSDELKRLTLKPYNCYDSSDIYTEVDEKAQKAMQMRIANGIKEYGRCWSGFTTWFLLDDPTPLKDFIQNVAKSQTTRAALLSDQKNLQHDIWKLKFTLERAESKLEKINQSLSALTELDNAVVTLPEGVSLK